MVKNKIDAKQAIAKLLLAIGLNGSAFAKKIGVNYQRIFDLQRGRVKKFHPDVVKAILDAFPNVNPRFLTTGEGEPLTDSDTNAAQKAVGDMVEEAVRKILGTEEYKARLFSIDNREKLLVDKEKHLAGIEQKLTDMQREFNDREKAIVQREEKINELERSLLRRELLLEIRDKESVKKDSEVLKRMQP